MKLLRKILMIAIIGMVSLNVVAMHQQQSSVAVLDFPTKMSGLNKDIVLKMVIDGTFRRCLMIVIQNTEAFSAFKKWKDSGLLPDALTEKGVIYFPTDGVQPTTADAEQWSCANVDADDINSPITNWYMQMFGNDSSLKLGFNTDNSPTPIISFANNMSSENVDLHLTGIQSFWNTFRQIAANPVGRILLYRILIEIRRIDDKKNGVQEYPIKSHSPDDSCSRNNARSLEIIMGNDMSSWIYIGGIKTGDYYNSRAQIKVFFPSNYQHYRRYVVHKKENNYYTALVNATSFNELSKLIADSLFHEMIHWYQQLRDYTRFDIESNINIKSMNQNNLPIILGYALPLFTGNIASWIAHTDDGVLNGQEVKVDEMRVICGAVKNEFYLEGDGLSENVFLCSENLKMVFGHDAIIESNTQESQAAQNVIIATKNRAQLCVRTIRKQPTFEWGFSVDVE
jgi:hypothetical protein